MAKTAVKYACAECGYTAGRWFGKCPGCSAFGTLIEDGAPDTAGSTVPKPLLRLVDVDAAEAERIGLVSSVVAGDVLLDTSYSMAERIIGYSRVGIEVTKRMLWSSLDASSLTAHMDHEGIAQLYVRLTTENFEEAVRARKEKRTPVYED